MSSDDFTPSIPQAALPLNHVLIEYTHHYLVSEVQELEVPRSCTSCYDNVLITYQLSVLGILLIDFFATQEQQLPSFSDTIVIGATGASTSIVIPLKLPYIGIRFHVEPNSISTSLYVTLRKHNA